MLTSQDVGGVMAMMPAFATAEADSLEATSTIHLDNLKAGVDRMIGDGADVIATTGSFGEFHTLLWEEFETITRAAVEAVNKRVPVFVGCTSLNSREVVRKMRLIQDAGADGVLLGVPFYYPSTIDNAVRFYHDIAEMFPRQAILIYHNPTFHNITIPVDAFRKISENRNVVGMKDSHRDTISFMKLMEIVRGKISVLVNQLQYYPYGKLGAAGCWSIDAWMGPWPVLRLRDAMSQGDDEKARQIALDLSGATEGGVPIGLRDIASKIAVAHAGYVNPGPPRPPFVEIPEPVAEAARKKAAYWVGLCEKYRAEVRAPVTA